MDFGDFAKLILRRWYVAGPMLLVTLFATVFVALSVKPDHVLTAYVQLVPPTSDAQNTQTTNNGAPRNPWNVLGIPALSQSAMLATEDQTFITSLVQQGLTDKIDIEQSYPNPVLTFTITGATRAIVERTADLLVQRYTEVTSKLQSQYNVAPSDMITTRRLDQGENVKTASGNQKRALIIIFAGGLLLTIGATVAVDAIMRRRQRKHGGAATAGKPAQGKPPVAGQTNGYIPGTDGARTETLPVTLSSGSDSGPGLVRTMAGKNQPPGVEYRSRSARGDLGPEEAPVRKSTVDADKLPPVGSDATIVLAMPKRTPDNNGGKRR